MTRTSVSETRVEMAIASREIAATLYILAVRLEPLQVAAQVQRLATMFVRLEREAQSDRPMRDLATIARAFESVAIKIGEACELASAGAAEQLGAKIADVSELADRALRVAGVRG